MSASGDAVVESTQLLPLLFDGLDAGPVLTVFDAGSAVSATVNFFSDVRCRLHFADLYADDIVRRQDNDCVKEAMDARFERLFENFDRPFDICLMWDFPNYLNLPALRAFGNALRPLIHRRTRAHAFCALKKNTPMMYQQYGIRQTDELVLTPRPEGLRAKYAYTQGQLLDALSFFEVQRGTLQRDGRVELLLHTASVST